MTDPVELDIIYDNNTANNELTSDFHQNDSQEKTITTSGGGSGGSTDLGISSSVSTGLYDAEKCRAYIANQIKVNKIDRFALQINAATDIEANNQIRIERLINMFTKCSSKVMHDFTMRCKLGLQSHRQDRILNNKRKKTPSFKVSNKQNNNIYKTTKLSRSKQQRYYYSTISNDLLYGVGAQLVRELLSPESISIHDTHILKEKSPLPSGEAIVKIEGEHERDKINHNKTAHKIPSLNDDDYVMSDYFEPKLFVKKMEDLLKTNASKSKSINAKLSKISQIFESLALQHRDKVDKVYAAEEGRQATSVTRRSAYNLSVAAIKATSTPVHINSNSND